MKDHRRAQLAKIHQAKKVAALDEDTYRALLVRVTGKRSSADMTPTERQAVLEEFTRLGVKVAPSHGRTFVGRPKHTSEVPMLRKIEALLADHKRPWSYAHAMAKRMFFSDRLEFLHEDQLHKVIQALEVDARRRAPRKPANSRKTHP